MNPKPAIPTVKKTIEAESNFPQLYQIANSAAEAIPQLDSGRITFQTASPSGNPEDWCAIIGNYGNYESYEPEHESDSYTAYHESYSTKQMCIDGVVVLERSFSIYEDGEAAAPLDEEPPSDEAMWAEYHAIRTGRVIKESVASLAKSLRGEQRRLLQDFFESVQDFYCYNGDAASSRAIQSAAKEIRFALPADT